MALFDKVIYVCSPLKGDIAGNIQKAREYCKKLIQAGYIPYAPHVALDGILDDNSPQERETALQVGVEMVKRCNELWIFGNIISEGMKREIEVASCDKIPILFFGENTLNKSEKTGADIKTLAAWIEEQLSEKRYKQFIQDLIAEGDNEHPTYEEWRKELEPDIITEADELKNKGVLQ